jgi:hypothetical protein
MNLRNALFTLLVLGLSFTLAVGQQTQEVSADSQPPMATGVSAGATPNPAPEDTNAPDLRILFTGYLLGYYRVPDVQPTDFLGDCLLDKKADDWANASPAARALHEAGDLWANASPPAVALRTSGIIPFKPDPNTIFVGMGDNFGVELYSRTYGTGDGPKIAEDLHPKLREPGAAWQPSDDGKIGDNVGCFLSMAGYTAVVPGKEDLYFGPERLRRIAQRLDSDRLRPRVPMLAANLIEQTTYWKDPAKIPDSEKELNFTPGLPDGIQAVEVSEGGKVLPFLRKITLRVKAGTGTDPGPRPEPYLCSASPSNDPDRLIPSGKKSIDANVCSPLNYSGWSPSPGSNQEEDPEKKQNDLVYDLPAPLLANANYGLCLNPSTTDTKKLPRCVRFSVARPFFLSAACLANGTGTTKWCSNYQKPYVFKKSDSGQVVIFGVVDPDVVGLVGRDNLSWKNRDSELRTEVAALDPLPALRQAVQFFEENEKIDNKSKLRWVLLAQMSRAKAEELAAHLTTDVGANPQTDATKGAASSLHFDVVIAAAADRQHATSPRTICLDSEPPQSSAASPLPRPAAPFRPIVVAPEWGLDPARKPINPVRELTLTDQLPDDECHATRKVVLIADRSPIDNGGQAQPPDVRRSLSGPASSFLNAPGQTDSFITATLRILREATNADFAIMQKRDFYWGPFRAPHDQAGGNVARVLWKGDVLRVITATGGTLKKVLQESKQFDQADLQATLEVPEAGRGLVYYGVEPTEGGNYLIDGALLDPNRLYTIATSNHIAVGDTGYPELNDPQFVENKLPKPPTLRRTSFLLKGQEAEGRQISEIVCLELKQAECVTLADDNALFAHTDQEITQVKAGVEARMKAWGFNSLNQPLFAKPEDRSSPELKAQDRPIWRFSLLQASFSFQESINNLSEKERAQLFTGFSAPGINGANSHQWQLSKQAEAVRSGKWLDEYARNQLDYSSQVNEQIAPALPSVSQSKNRDQFDAGIFFHPLTTCSNFRPWCRAPRKELPKIGMVFEPFRFDSPLAQEELIIGPRTNEQKVNLGRTQNVLARTGLRIEDEKSHFEAGYEAGWERGALVTFVAGSTSCPPLPDQSPFGCLTSLVPPVHVDQVRETRDQRGFYVDYAWTTPIPVHNNWKNIVQLQGEWFPFGPASDNSSDTRKLYDINEKLSIPIFSSLSFQPGGEYYLYRNKFGPSPLIRWTPSASLTWSFDRYSGGKWGKSLGYSPNAASGSGPK